MRSLERNKVPFYYALYNDKIPVLDDWGNETGEYTSGYNNPVKFRARISANRGESSADAFGLSLDYDRVIYTADKTFPLDEFSICWVDIIPILNEDGSTTTPNDYTVKKSAKDLNEWQFAIKKQTTNSK